MKRLAAAGALALLAGCASTTPTPIPVPQPSVVASAEAHGCLKYERSSVPKCIGDAVVAAHRAAAQECAAGVLRADYQVQAGLTSCLERYRT